MNFCSIEDAWGDNKISSSFQKYMGDRTCSEPTKLECPVIEENKNVERFTNREMIREMNCDDILKHVETCNYCYNKLYYKFNRPVRNEFINNLHNIINNNKDLIVLILIGLFIALFFKLVINITNSEK